MILELCVDNIAAATLAKHHLVKRIELCSALSVGGLTPSLSLTKKCVELNASEVHVMLRHREGNFIYNKEEIEILLADLRLLAEQGIDGVVVGCLNENRNLDSSASQLLAATAKQLNLEITFHRAFDFLEEPLLALDQLIDMGYDRVLTSGYKPRAIEGIEAIENLVTYAKGRIQIMAGGGVDASNAQALCKAGVDSLHFTVHHKLEVEKDMGYESTPFPEKLHQIAALF